MSVTLNMDKLKLQSRSAGVSYLRGGSVSGQERASTEGTSSARTGKSFDEVMIRTHGDSDETNFIKSAVSKISVEVRKSASPDLLEELHSQVASGAYGIDAYAIAGRILLEDGGAL